MTNLRARLAEVLAGKSAARMFDIADFVYENRDAIARALEDAERYAWLRLRWDGEYAIDLNAVPDSYWAPKAAPDLDTAIDAARNRHDRPAAA